MSPRRPIPGPRPPEDELWNFGGLITRNSQLKQVMTKLAKVAATDLNVLLIGETGTGKELIARYIHAESRRRSEPMISVDCGTISKQLFESTFFGYEGGAFTGADSRGRRGLFEAAKGGTLFLDEIGEMPLPIQAGLLRVLEMGVFRPIGSDREVTADCRIIAATNRPLSELAEQGTFRSDLYYRLSVAKFTIPPLRERPEDISPLVEHMRTAFCEKHGVPGKTLSPDAASALERYSWPGNVRELRNMLESGIICGGSEIGLRDLPADVVEAGTTRAAVARSKRYPERRRTPGAGGEAQNVRDQERGLILRALASHKRIGLAAEALGISRSTLYRKLEALNIDHRALFERSRKDRGNERD